MSNIAILASCLAVVYSQCPLYVCDPPYMEWPASVCAMVDYHVLDQYDVRSDFCATDEECQCGLSPAICIKTAITWPVAYPGESCRTTNDCIGGSCADGKCTGLSLGVACKTVYDCGAGLTCAIYGPNPGFCTKQVQPGGVCYVNSDCQPNAGCAGARPYFAPPTPGQCLRYLGVPPQNPVPWCTAYDTELELNVYCQSGYCYQPANSSALCSDFVANAEPVPTYCQSAADSCISTNDSGAHTNITNSCGCGFDGNYYCELFPGDSDMRTYISYLIEYLESESLLACSTARNNGNPPTYAGNWCAETTADASSEWLYSYYRATQYTQIVRAADCVLKVAVPGYYATMQTINSAQALTAIAALVASF